MDNEQLLFKKGCFLPSWAEDTQPTEQTVISYVYRHKDLATLLSELDDIKKHIEDVKERQWILAKLMNYHNNNFARE